MSLIKLAFKNATEIDADYKDNRPFIRRAKGKLIGYTIGLPLAPLAPIVGHFVDRHRKEIDFRRHPELFHKYKH